MKIQTIFRMPSPYRDDFRIKAYTFGNGAKTLCIVGSMRGDEIQQQYVAGCMVRLLRVAEERNLLADDVSISIIPCANPSSVNIEKRFWALDGTDINRMFPGYEQGETTQRIASGIFEFVKDFRYGIQLASYYLPGNFLPHVSIIHTKFENVDEAQLFGLPFVVVNDPKPFDTVLLNYNWQIWDTHAYSIYAGTTDVIDQEMSQKSIDAIGRFMIAKGIMRSEDAEESVAQPTIVSQAEMINIKAPRAGIFMLRCTAGQQVKSGEKLASIMHPCEGYEICSINSPVDATVFFLRNKSICFQNTLLFRLIPRC
ncbi:MAG: M14 family metallopeptidase [Bacteroidales bacterium]|nr:M14 family metallopeptidase [Bacteroidales bacterium]